MAEHGCEDCKLRAKYDSRPKSLLGRFWRWHINWCPGWKAYITSLPDQERTALTNRYDLAKYR